MIFGTVMQALMSLWKKNKDFILFIILTGAGIGGFYLLEDEQIIIILESEHTVSFNNFIRLSNYYLEDD